MSGQGPTYHYEEPPKLPGKEELYLIKFYQLFPGSHPTPLYGAPDRQDHSEHSNQVMMALSYQDQVLYLISGRGRGPPRSPGPVQAEPLAAR